MPTFDAPALPSPLAIRECMRPRFDGDLEQLHDWLNGLKSVGVRQAGPGLMLALENLRRAEISPSRRLSVLSTLKAPLLKTCASLPKPKHTGGAHLPTASGVTLEQRLYRLMFVNLHQSLRQLDQSSAALSERLQRKREWAIRNLFRFANRQIRYAARWNTPLPAQTWSDLHRLHLELMNPRTHPGGLLGSTDSSMLWMDPELEYKQLLLFGLAAQLNAAIIQRADFLAALEGWAAQTLLTDPQRMMGRIKLFVVEIDQDKPPCQESGALNRTFRGWILQAPYPFIHQIEDEEDEGIESSPLDFGDFAPLSRPDSYETAGNRYLW